MSVVATALPDFSLARFNMIESQLRPNKVRNLHLLDAMGRIPRELFVPGPLAGIAYVDEDLHVSPGRYLTEPMVLARLIEEGGIKKTDRVLDVAPATGYSTAVLAALAKEVVGLESDPALHKQASENLVRFAATNARMELGNFADGWSAGAPYDFILINGAVEVYPETLLAQLTEGGRLVLVAHLFGPARAAHKGEARIYEKIRGNISRRTLFEANTQPLPGFLAAQRFVF